MMAKVTDHLGTLDLFISAIFKVFFFIKGLHFSRSVLDVNVTLKYWMRCEYAGEV